MLHLADSMYGSVYQCGIHSIFLNGNSLPLGYHIGVSTFLGHNHGRPFDIAGHCRLIVLVF